MRHTVPHPGAAAGLMPPRWHPRQLLGLGIVLAGLLAIALKIAEMVTTAGPQVQGALTGGSIAALATALGTLPVLLSQHLSQRTCDAMLGFGAGVMLAACSFSLIVPALDAAKAQGAGAWGAGGIVAASLVAGAMLLLAMDRLIPHEHFVKGAEGPQALALKRVWLFVFAIALHNLPEGLAIGVAFGGTDPLAATALATGIAIQDVPEGMVVALALRGIGYGRLASAGLGVLSGLTEPIAAVAGAAAMALSSAMLPLGLATAAGAMLYVISHEIIPESHRQGHERFATGGLVLGFVLMMLLDTALA